MSEESWPGLNKKDPYRNAKLFNENRSRTTHGTDRPLWFHKKKFYYLWPDAPPEEVEPMDIRAQVWEFLGKCHIQNSNGFVDKFQPTKGDVDQTIDALRALLYDQDGLVADVIKQWAESQKS